MNYRKFCQDCGLPGLHHIQTWLEELIDKFVPDARIFKKRSWAIDFFMEKILGAVGLIKIEKDFPLDQIALRSACFIKEAGKRGVEFCAIKGPFGYTNHFRAKISGKTTRFESLPTADFVSAYSPSLIDNKERARKHLERGGFPATKGKSFWFYEKGRAMRWGIDELGFPLVVKPLSGSVARHVSIDIKSKEDLSRAIDHALAYSPVFIIERFIADAFVHRATVVDFDRIFCVRQVQAHITGDGVSTVLELIKRKNEARKENRLMRQLAVNEAATCIPRSVPAQGEVVYFQKKPFLRLGGDLEEVTERVHSDNIKLFRDIAEFFDIRLVGMDFIAEDISRSWKDQECAVLELNSVPCIEMHHFPSSGMPTNPAGALADMFLKYYA